MYDCYNNIFGFSQDDCECTNEGRPLGYNTSASGLYLDELAPIHSILSLEKCGKDMWTMLQNARDLSIKKLVADSNSLLGKKYSLKRKQAKNQVIGERKAQNVISTPDKNYGVIRIRCCPIRGGYMNLNVVGVVYSASGSVNFTLHNNVDGQIGTYSFSSSPNSLATLPVNLELPLYSKYVEVLEYYLVFPFDQNNLPKDTEINCGCGNWTPVFNSERPYYHNVGYPKNSPWSDYIMVGSTQINSLSDLEYMDESSSSSNKMLGTVLDINFGCKVGEVLCKDSLDFEGNPLALSLAFAAMYSTAVKVAEDTLQSNLLSRDNMIGRDQLEDSILVWTEKYNEHINYIVDSVDHTTNDCLTCRDLLGMTRQGLFS